MRIAIGCASFCSSRGGTERVAANLAHEMTERGHNVLIISLNSDRGLIKPAYFLHPSARHMAWKRTFGKHEDIQYIKKFLIADGTDVFLSMQSDHVHLFWAMCCMGSGIPFICSERIDPVAYIEKKWSRPGRLAVLSGADCIHEQLPAYTYSIPEIWRDKVRIIPNALPISPIPANPRGEPGKRKHILFLARITEQKRPLLLLEAFRLLLDKYPDWDLLIYGSGNQKEKVKHRIKQNRMENRVFMMGISEDAAGVYSAAQIYCLPSSFEGFPNTLLEAMAAGLPVVACAECAAARAILQNSQAGLLVEQSSPRDLAKALDKLMANADLCVSMGESAKIASAEYDPRRIYDQWEKLFTDMVVRKGNTVMDSFYNEPFASAGRLSASARREYLYRDFGGPMPYTFSWFKQKGARILKKLTTAWRVAV